MRRTGAGLFLSAPHNDDPPVPSSLYPSFPCKSMSKLAGALPSARPRVSQGTASQQMLLSENALKACASFGYVFIEGEAGCRLTRD